MQATASNFRHTKDALCAPSGWDGRGHLPSLWIKCNGHMQMIEMNNLKIARYYERWLLQKLQ